MLLFVVDIPIELPCLGELENQKLESQLLVQEVPRGIA